VLVLGEEFSRGFAKRVFAWVTEEMDLPSLGHASREQRLSLGQVSAAGSLADSLAVDDLVGSALISKFNELRPQRL
jgi:hypothetical protein